MPQAWIPPRGELEKKVIFSPCCGDETTTYYDRAYGKACTRPPTCVGNRPPPHTEKASLPWWGCPASCLSAYEESRSAKRIPPSGVVLPPRIQGKAPHAAPPCRAPALASPHTGKPPPHPRPATASAFSGRPAAQRPLSPYPALGTGIRQRRKSLGEEGRSGGGLSSESPSNFPLRSHPLVFPPFPPSSHSPAHGL